tara:strand:- start:2078 stop:3013 length:936 start_codon:yes stop_codon:yes gene_type:complete
MSRKQSIPKETLHSEKYDYEVEQLPLYDHKQRPVVVGKSPIFGNFRADTGVCLGTSTKQYEIVNNGVVVEKVEEALRDSNLGEFKSSKIATRDGARFYGVYDFPRQQEEVSVGDVVSMRLTLNNSFDRSCGLSWSLGLLRLVCSNGMVSMVSDTSLSQRHSTRLSFDSITESLNECVDKYRESVGAFKKMKEFELSKEQGELILDNLAIRKVLSESLKDSITPIWTNKSFRVESGRNNVAHDRNMYNLYNAVTQHLTHDVQEHRFELSTRANRSVLSNLHKATREPLFFNKLTAKVPEKQKTATVVDLAAN